MNKRRERQEERKRRRRKVIYFFLVLEQIIVVTILLIVIATAMLNSKYPTKGMDLETDFIFQASAAENETESRPEPETEPKTEPETETEAETEAEEWRYLGEFTVTAYCPCAICCGQWAGGPTSSGAWPEEGVTAAADPDVLPAGSLIDMGDGNTRIIQDTGGGVKGNHIDIYMESHEAACQWGVQQKSVWLYVGK